MRILAIITGEYGQRHVDNIRAHGPADWQVEVWQAPAVLPPVIDYPEDYLPGSLPPADLLLAFGEHKGVAELVPEIARMTGVRAGHRAGGPGGVAAPGPGPATARLAGRDGRGLRHSQAALLIDRDEL